MKLSDQELAALTDSPWSLPLVDPVRAVSTLTALTAELSQARAELEAERIKAHGRGVALSETMKELAAMRAGAPDGWKLVPVEPTEHMVMEGACRVSLPHAAMEADASLAIDAYVAMLAAAPQPPAQPRKLTLAEFQARVGTGPVFPDTDPEAAWIEASKHACPHCGGSGHKDDVTPAQPVAVEVRPLSFRELSRWQSLASTAFGSYLISHGANGGKTTLFVPGNDKPMLFSAPDPLAETPERQAENAANAHYRDAILSAINARPVDAVKAEALREEAERWHGDGNWSGDGVGYQLRRAADRLDPKGGA